MTTRSKCIKVDNILPPNDDDEYDDEIDEAGNLKGFIDYECNDEFDRKEFDNVLKGFSGKNKFKKKDKKKQMNDILISYHYEWIVFFELIRDRELTAKLQDQITNLEQKENKFADLVDAYEKDKLRLKKQIKAKRKVKLKMFFF